MVVAELFERVAALRDQGRTIVLVEQYLTYALELADLCYVLAKGQVELGRRTRRAQAHAVSDRVPVGLNVGEVPTRC